LTTLLSTLLKYQQKLELNQNVKIAANQDQLQSVKMLQRRIEGRNDSEKEETTVSILHVVLYYCV